MIGSLVFKNIFNSPFIKIPTDFEVNTNMN